MEQSAARHGRESERFVELACALEIGAAKHDES
jgi:hypothetical protein